MSGRKTLASLDVSQGIAFASKDQGLGLGLGPAQGQGLLGSAALSPLNMPPSSDANAAAGNTTLIQSIPMPTLTQP